MSMPVSAHPFVLGFMKLKGICFLWTLKPKNTVFRVFCAALLVQACTLVPAEAQLFPNLGGQRVGISAFTFLKNDLSPRSMAMGGANAALGSDSGMADGYAVANNPALGAEIRHLTVTASNLNYGGGINHAFLSVAVPTKNRGCWLFSVNDLGTGPQTLRTELQPNGNGQQFFVNSFAAGAGFSKSLSDMFSFGVNIKYIREQLAEYNVGTAAVDLGFLYRTDYRNLRFAAALQNFGINSTLSGSGKPVAFMADGNGAAYATSAPTESFSGSTQFKMGISIDAVKIDHDNLITASVQLNHPNDNAENIRLGLEYSFRNLLYVRAGQRINLTGQAYPSGGVGVHTQLGRHKLAIDYAAQPTDYMGTFQSVGLSFSLVPEAAADLQHGAAEGN